jgi:hypothetical protein
MRSPRIAIVVLALALAASMSFTSSASARVSPSDASPAATPAALGAPVAARTSARAAEDIRVGAKIVKRRVRPGGPKRLVLTGAVVPSQGPVYIQRATKCNRAKGTCNFKFYKKRYLKKGRYTAIVGAPPTLRGWVFRAKVKNSYSEAWITCTRRPAQDCKLPT